MLLFFGVPVHIILHALSVLVVLCVAAMNINYQRSPKTDQFTTAKISGNALKQVSRNRGTLSATSAQLTTARRIAVDQKVCGGMADTQG